MNCICCNKDTYIICIDCNIEYYDDHMTLPNDEAIRKIGKYEIIWTKNHTQINNTELYEPIGGDDDFDSTIIKLDGWKLFDIRTKEQLEKLLILL